MILRVGVGRSEFQCLKSKAKFGLKYFVFVWNR